MIKIKTFKEWLKDQQIRTDSVGTMATLVFSKANLMGLSTVEHFQNLGDRLVHRASYSTDQVTIPMNKAIAEYLALVSEQAAEPDEVEETNVLIKRYGNPFLAKAIMDEFELALGLQSGQEIHCTQLTEVPESNYAWLFIDPQNLISMTRGSARVCLFNESPATFDRGIYIRVSDISWIADAPFGS